MVGRMQRELERLAAEGDFDGFRRRGVYISGSPTTPRKGEPNGQDRRH
jgi:hypothetical protein